MSKLYGWLCGLALVASLILAAAYYKNVLLLQDGGWYSYPAYAIEKGGDPSENMPGYTIPVQHPGVTAKFIWENRTNLFVGVQWLGIKLFGDTWQGLRQYGALEWVLIAIVSALIIWEASRSKYATLIVFSLVFSDSVLIGSALSNARPDVVNALLGLLGILAIDSLARKPNWLNASGAFAVAVTLPLIHVTSGIATALLGLFTLLSIRDLKAIRDVQIPRIISTKAALYGLLCMAAALFAVYLFRLNILDHFIATNVPVTVEKGGQHDLVQKILGNYGAGFGQKLSMEGQRWKNYFVIKNISHLAFIGLGIVLLLKPLRTETYLSIFSRRLALATLGAALFQLATDPHGTPSHLIIIMLSAYLFSTLRMLDWINTSPETARRINPTILALFALIIFLRVGHSYKIHQNYTAVDYNNYTVESLLAETLRPQLIDNDSRAVIYGPTELWPYLTKLPGQITIIDIDRSKVAENISDVFKDGVQYLFINEDYTSFGWDVKVAQWEREGTIQKIFARGDCSPGRSCLAAYKPAGSLVEKQAQ